MTNNSQGQRLSIDALVTRLQGLVHERRTGTVFLLTDAKRYLRIGLKRGRITHLVYGKFKGSDALEHIARVESGVYSFSENVVSDAEELQLPPTEEILQWFGGQMRSRRGLTAPPPAPLGVSTRHQEAPPSDTAIPSAALAASSSLELGGSAPLRLSGPALQDAVNRELALYLGPIAPLVTSDYRIALLTATTADEVLGTVRAIAGEIADPDQSEEFCRRAMERALRG